MIKICYIAPYPELVEQIESLFQKHPLKDQLNYSTYVFPNDSEYTQKIDEYDVVVARGYAADQLRGYDIPLIDIQISPYDIIRAIDECIELYRPRRIAFLWSESVLYDVEEVCKLYSCPITIYKVSEKDLGQTINKAVADGCDVFVGGYILKTHITNREQIHYSIIQTGRPTLKQSIDEAIRTVRVIKKERENAELCRIITQQNKDAIIYVGVDMHIGLINSMACGMASVKDEARVGAQLNQVFPYMLTPVKTVLGTGETLQNEIHHIMGDSISADYVPLTIRNEVSGVVVTFQRVTEIQKTELKIRQHLSAKGLKARYVFDHFIFKSDLMARTIETAKRYAHVSSNIMIIGETGTGKELMAQSIHSESPRKGGPFVAVNCASFPEHLLESELFGYVEGAFTGAVKGGKPGLFELAHNGTLFLDEISELPFNFQSKLLRALQEREIRRVGGDKVIQVNIRVIAATNKGLREMIRQGTFREDLFYRLNVLQVDIYPLRQRCEDILALFEHYLLVYCTSLGRTAPALSKTAQELLVNYDFPGNVRELCNLAERVSVTDDSLEITGKDVQLLLYGVYGSQHPEKRPSPPKLARLDSTEEEHLIRQTLEETSWHLGQTAKLLDIDRSTLWRKMKRHMISK